MDCIFCKIVRKEIPSSIVYEDANVIAILDINPIASGHTLIIPKEHSENLIESKEETLKEMLSIIKRVSLAVVKGTQADGFNLILNNGRPAGQVIPHLHFHIIPRKVNDNVDFHWIPKKYNPGEIDQIANAISKNMA